MKIDLREIPVVWINLDSATDNAKAMQERLDKHGFKKTYRKSACVIPPPPGTPREIAHYVGCGKSHLDILENKDYSTPLLILEDDAEFSKNFTPIIDIPDDSDGIYLGVSSGNVYYKTKRHNPDYLRISGILATHAILYVTETYRNAMAAVYNYCINVIKRPWDMGASALQSQYKVYTPNKPFFYQSDNRESANKWQFFTDGALEDRNSEI